MSTTEERFNWGSNNGLELTVGGGAEDQMKTLLESTTYETKAGQRRVRDPGFWGLPYGTLITPGMKPRAAAIGKLKTPRKKAPAKTPAKKPRGSGTSQLGKVKKPATPAPAGRTGGSGKTTADKPAQANTGRSRPRAADRASNIAAAFGETGMVYERRNNARVGKYDVEYGSPAEVKKARDLAIKRAKTLTPRPDKDSTAKGKWIIKVYGMSGSGKGDIRGDTFQRSQRQWDLYVAYGGVDPKTGKDKGYVCCVSCGMKMSWHEDKKRTKYPKFEQDKIITTGDGGSYVTQNLMPMCAGCNIARGSKNLWEADGFKAAKPAWYDAFAKAAKSIRASEAASPMRPASAHAGIPMPVPPGKRRDRSKAGRKDAFERAEGMWNVTDIDQFSGDPTTGDRVTAQLLNFDGRYNSPEIFPPDVDDPLVTVVGYLIIEEVDSAFGEYTRATVIDDNNAETFVELDTATTMAEGPDYADESAFGPKDTNSGGGGGGGRGRLDGGSGSGRSGVRGGGSKSFSLDLDTKERAAYLSMSDDPQWVTFATKMKGVFPAQLRKYWLGEGLARWATTPTPYRALVAALRKEGVAGHMINGLAAKLYHWHFGTWPGKKGGGKKEWDDLVRLERKLLAYIESKDDL